MEMLNDLIGFGKLLLGYVILLIVLVLTIKDIQNVKKPNLIISLIVLLVGFVLWTMYAINNFL